MCLFAYLYTRPMIRRRLGSASAGYINWSSVYVVWLCAAVFYHLPSLESMGLDVKADISMALTVFLLSLLVLGGLATLHGIGVVFNMVAPRLLFGNAGAREVFSAVILNAFNFSIATSTYYSFCGNAADHSAGKGLPANDGVRAIICGCWLHPLSASQYPAFTRWVIYGESTNAASSLEFTNATGSLGSTIRTAQSISPVFTTWLTVFSLFLANCLADYTAGAVLTSAMSKLTRKSKSGFTFRSRRHSRRNLRGRSLEIQRSSQFNQDVGCQKKVSMGRAEVSGPLQSVDTLLKTVSSVGSLWSPAALDSLRGSILGFRDDHVLLDRSGIGDGRHQRGLSQELNDISKTDDELGIGLTIDANSPRPNFLPMFPWYSGTSADLLKTLFDLMVSVKLFLGRFDQRTLQAISQRKGEEITDRISGDQHQNRPMHGDGFLFEHLAHRNEAWLDFCADTGDGGDPTYSIARCMAAREVRVTVPKTLADASDYSEAGGIKVLPRAQALIHGGDLAYPNPTDETYEQRLFGPYQDAFPTPSHVHPGQLVVQKPDLPRTGDQGDVSARKDLRCACEPCNFASPVAPYGAPGCASAALAAYDGPSAFLIPGNHDWIDGLETFQRHIIHKGWLGGWLMPQEKSYFALRLPHGWWLFALDLALVDDLDMSQYRYFARIAQEKMGPTDAAIIVTHCPHWLIDWYWGKHSGKNLRQLVRGVLKGRARMHLAGDLHFYMRHSFQTYARDGAPGGISPPASELSTPAGASPVLGGSPTSSKCPTPLPMLGSPPQRQLHQSLVRKLRGVAVGARGKSIGGSSDDECATSYVSYGGASPVGEPSSFEGQGGLNINRTLSGSPPNILGQSPPQGWWPSLHVRTSRPGGGSPTSEQSTSKLRRSAFSASGIAIDGEWNAPPPGWVLNDPEHLVVCGAGGAFQHPTHVFSYARFRPPHDPAAGPLYKLPENGVTNGDPLLMNMRRPFPSDSNLNLLSCGKGLERKLEKEDLPTPAGGEYRCQAAFPTEEASFRLGRANLHAFRHVNSRFDVIGGVLYYLLVISCLPRCSGVDKILEATSIMEALVAAVSVGRNTILDIFASSYISLIALILLFAIVLGFAKSGGVGAISDVPASARRKPEYRGFALAVRTRLGGFPAQLSYALAHAAAHLTAATLLLVLLELGVEMVIRYEGVGQDGYHSLYRWYRRFEDQHFPDPAGLRSALSTVTFGLYPLAIKWAFALFDVPESIAVARTLMCEAGGLANLTRIQTIGYYGGVLLYFWVLATPTVGFVFGLYLYVSGNWLHVHYDEAFSALQVADNKGFLRLHVTPEGDIEVFSLGLKKVPTEWREDPRWKTPGGGGEAGAVAHQARWPSRWMPVEERGIGRTVLRTVKPPEAELEVVDYFRVPKSKRVT